MGTLSAKSIDALLKRGKPGRYADGDGLFLEIRPSQSSGAGVGAITHYWLLRIQARKRRHEFGLGSGRKVSLQMAREKAAAHRSTLMDGGDPAERGKVKAKTPTFKEAATDCIAEHVKGLTNKKAKDQWTNTLKAHVYTLLGSLPVDRIETRDVLRALSPIWTNKPETARRVRQRIEKVLDWAKAHGHRSGDNPASMTVLKNVLAAQTKAVKHHAALPYGEVGKFVVTLRDSAADAATRLAFEFLILTACRTIEVVQARWCEVDFAARTWTVPPERLKVKKGGRPHVVPLSDRALEILTEAKTLGGAEWVFPSPLKKRKPLSTGAFDGYIDRAGLTGKVTGHGFRSSFRDWCSEETTFPNEVCEMALAHAIKSDVEAAYRRGNLLAKRATLMQTWTNFVTGRMAVADNVRPLRAS